MMPGPASSWSLTARWILPVAGPPLERGIVTISGARILAVERAGSRPVDLDLGQAAVVPGLVNAHTHLDLSGLRNGCPPGSDFTAWLRAVVQHRRGLSGKEVAGAIRLGLEESLACGTTLIGDISAGGASWKQLTAAPVRAVVFRELLGLPVERAEQTWKEASAWIAEHPATATCRPGLSPHAPYSVRQSLFEAAAASSLPVAIHVAETRDELQLLEEHAGSFVPFLTELGVWSPEGLVQGLPALLNIFAARHPGPLLLVHGNFLDPTFPLPNQATVIYCPRTHAAFGHDPHPWRQLLAKGVRVALGTDSLGSNPDLDVLGELRFLHRRHPEVQAALLLRLATQNGATALGWGTETGSLEAGKSADLVVVPLPEREEEPHRLLLESEQRPQGVLFRGQWIVPPGEN